MPTLLTSPWYYIAGSGACALGLLYWGWRDFRRRGMSMSIFVRWLLAVSILALSMPSLLSNRIRLDDERMTWRTGYWWAETSGSIRFADVASVEVRKEQRHLFQGSSRTATIWRIRMKDGRTEDHEVSDLWMTHYRRIKQRFESAGVVFEGPHE